jgi:TolB-like protein
MSLFAELRRRNVIRMAGLYLVGAWLLLQVAETLLPIFDTPGWVLKALVVLLALGFVPALVFAWIYELTPDGLKRDAEVPAAQSIAPQTAQRMDRLILLGLVAAVAVVAVDRLWPEVPMQSQAAASASQAAVPTPGAPQDKSIAVLPFADFSPGGDQAWFADGLAEEILNALARTPDLQVSARTSSFRYKGSALAVPQIAAELGVAHVLEGSVRSTPQRVRVTAQLIRAADGFHLWSQNYDRDLADMIEIQEDLARQIATAMHTSMDPEALADMAAVGTRSVEAYQAYIRGVAKVLGIDAKDNRDAYAYFEEARALDPTFAAAHWRAAAYWIGQMRPTQTVAIVGDTPYAGMSARFAERIDLAIAHAATDTERLGYRALKAERDLRMREAISVYQSFLSERPGHLEATNQLLALVVGISDDAAAREILDRIWPLAQTRIEFAVGHLNNAHRLPDRKRAADEALVLAERWPDHRSVLYQVHRALLWDRRVADAGAILERLEAVSGPDNEWSLIPPARQACAEGRRREVEQVLESLDPADLSQRWHLLMLLGRHDDASALLRPLDEAGNTYALAGFLGYRHFDPAPFPSLLQVLEREKVQRAPPVLLPFACPTADSPGGPA